MKSGFVLIYLFLIIYPSVSYAGLFSFSERIEMKKQETQIEKLYALGSCREVLTKSDYFLNNESGGAYKEKVYYMRGRCLEKLKENDRALTVYNLASGLYPDNMDFIYRRAIIYSEAGFKEKAIPMLKKILAKNPDDIDANVAAADSYADIGFLDRAAEFYDKAAGLQKYADEDTVVKYAFCLLRLRRWDEVGKVLKKSAADRKDEISRQKLRARVYAGEGDYRSAAEELKTPAEGADKRRTDMERAVYLTEAGLYAEAEKTADVYLAADGKDRFAALVKGLSAYKSGRRDEAKKYFIKASGNSDFVGRLAKAFLERGKQH